MEYELCASPSGRVKIVSFDERAGERLRKYGIGEGSTVTVLGNIRSVGVIVSVGNKNFVLTKKLAEKITVEK